MALNMREGDACAAAMPPTQVHPLKPQMRSTHSELFADLTEAEVQEIESLGTRIRLDGGDTLFDLGVSANSLYLIIQGRIALTMPMTVRGREQDVLVEERGPGQSVGWSALIPPHRFTLKGSAPLAAEILAIPRADLTAYLESHPAVGYRLSRNVATVVGQRLQVVQAMWLREVQRVATLTTT
jgi:CRP/FNR family cyclic AMP-dependent transcriptional regulator